MAEISIDSDAPLPIIDARIFGPLGAHKIKLIFDTGSQYSIIDTGLVEDIGYSARDAVRAAQVRGATGDPQGGYLVSIKAMKFFGKKAENVIIGAYDFEHFSHFGAHGVLGFDVIKKLHLELDGPKGLLKVY